MPHWFLLLLTCLLLPSWSSAADDLMDQYASLPGSYMFVRRAPEGAVTTRVKMEVFEDFLCPSCYRFSTEIIPQLQEKYGDRLDLRLIGYPLVHEESRLPARAYVIAQEMGLGEQMQKELFHAHFEQQLDTTNKDGLAKVAHTIGLDPELLLSRLDKNDGSTEVDRNLALGESYHIDAVPGVVFDGWILVKEMTPQNLETIINGLLEKKKPTPKVTTKKPQK
ncbi:MAG: thioredoxin domain-containing protein [Deltaproteobacteria bacterium]|nr:thioredoxin domain-containing protein [Deltaproteobacteria bacterium]